MNADYKKQKAGKSFPGDISRGFKIQMIERPEEDIEIYYGGDHTQVISSKAAKSYRQEINKRKNKRFRQQSRLEDQKWTK